MVSKTKRPNVFQYRISFCYSLFFFRPNLFARFSISHLDRAGIAFSVCDCILFVLQGQRIPAVLALEYVSLQTFPPFNSSSARVMGGFGSGIQWVGVAQCGSGAGSPHWSVQCHCPYTNQQSAILHGAHLGSVGSHQISIHDASLGALSIGNQTPSLAVARFSSRCLMSS